MKNHGQERNPLISDSAADTFKNIDAVLSFLEDTAFVADEGITDPQSQYGGYLILGMIRHALRVQAQLLDQSEGQPPSDNLSNESDDEATH